MAASSTFTPKASLTEAPTNLKEAIDWVLRVTGRDGKPLNKETECICGLASAVTDLLQSVELQYHGYQGEAPNKGADADTVKGHLNGLFSLVQGLGGTSVVRTYIDQLAQVLSALVGWSRIEKCKGSQKDHGTERCNNGGSGTCKYLEDVVREDRSCDTCGCIKGGTSSHLGRGCTRCKDSGGSVQQCQCSPGGGDDSCTADKECQCAKAGKCCKCYCKDECTKCKDKKQRECSCVKENEDKKDLSIKVHEESYQSAYWSYPYGKHFEQYGMTTTWKSLMVRGTAIYGMVNGGNSSSHRRHHCAKILLGSVCLIWSGITYLYWTGKQYQTSPRWNNHILDGSGLDDGTLSQWLQALGFPKEMLNDNGPGNRLDEVITETFTQKFFMGYADTSGSNGGVKDRDGNTFRSPAKLHFGGFIHEINKGASGNTSSIFKGNGTGTETNQHKLGPLYKLYILSCAYFTGLQKKTTQGTPRTPKTIREILYWLSALPYSEAYKDLLEHCKDLHKNKATDLKFSLKGGGMFTIREPDYYSHFQAVTQYCPLVLIGIQGGIHSTKGSDNTKEPAIHSLYANTEFSFTYPTVPIQAYNQVVHYIRGLFYQLYFLRKQCAVKVTCGGKWRECRYGNGVLGKGVISWMCLGCDPMEHDRKNRVEKVEGVLKAVSSGEKGDLPGALKVVLENIGDVVVQLGNAQEALERRKGEEITKVKEQLEKAKQGLETAKGGLNENKLNDALRSAVQWVMKELGESTGKLEELTGKNGGGSKSGILGEVETKLGQADKPSPAKDEVSKAIHKVLEVLKEMEKAIPMLGDKQNDQLSGQKDKLLSAIEDLISICNSPKCSACKDHSTKCGKPPVSKQCPECHQQYMDGTPSPLQAFLEDRLPGFSCEVVRNTDTEKDTVYPPAGSHLHHTNSPGQCCPLPMGFRNQFQKGSTTDCTGARLYGILYFFSNENMMQSCVYRLVRVTAELSATTPQVLGDVFGFFRGGVGNKEEKDSKRCDHTKDPKDSKNKNEHFCGWCASGLREEVKKIGWIPKKEEDGGQYRGTVGQALIDIKGDKDTASGAAATPTALSALTKDSQYISPLTGELYTAVSATFGGTYLSWVLYLSDSLYWGLESLSEAFRNVECRSCKGQCDPNKCKKGSHGVTGGRQCGCQSIVSCTGVLPVLYRHGFSYGNPFNLEGYQQGDGKDDGQYDITNTNITKRCHEFLESLSAVIEKQQEAQKDHPLTKLLLEVGQLQYDIRLPWIFVLTIAWLVAVLYLAFGAIWPLDWVHMRSHWLRGGEHQWQCMWYKVMTGRKGMELVEYFGRR